MFGRKSDDQKEAERLAEEEIIEENKRTEKLIKFMKQKEKVRKIQEESELAYVKQVSTFKPSTKTPNRRDSLGKNAQTVEQAKVEEEKQVKKKADYIDEKVKLTEKELLAEIILLLENIRNDAKINSETMNQTLKNIAEYSADSSNELKYSREDDKTRHKENKDTTWEIS